jgi:ribosomal protein S12 methylthiotransferase
MTAKVGLISLGCAKNLVDSEVMLGFLKQAGYDVSSELEECDIVIVNTCAFIEEARAEAVDTILEAADLKTKGKLKKLVVAGCLPERYGEELIRLMPEIDLILGVDEVPYIADILKEGESVFPERGRNPVYLYDDYSPRVLSTPSPTAYVKIAEGCSNHCSFCIVPRLRGSYRSREPDSLVAEVKKLASAGFLEINLIAQDTTFYGHDLGEPDLLPLLLRRLNEISDIHWIRLLYSHPEHLTDGTIAAISSCEKVVPYLDLPFQHASKRMLDMMGRKGDKDGFLKQIQRLRRDIEGLALRTSLIVGFPGEKEVDFSELLSFASEASFDHLGAFIYSPEEGTRAFSLGDPVPYQLKMERLRELMELQQDISRKRNQRFIGRKLEVLVEEVGDISLGRAASQAPEVDGGVVILEGDARPGDFSLVEIDQVTEYDLIGRIIR